MFVEEKSRLSQSIIWELQRKYYENAGPNAWNTQEVPHYITNNSFIAELYASQTLKFMEVLQHEGETRMNILELGAGSGRFAFLFLRHFLKNYRKAHSGIAFTYYLSDFTSRNIDAWREHPQFKPLVEEGLLDFCTVDATYLEEVPRTLFEGHPLVLVANYFFDTIPQDAFFHKENQLYENLASVKHRQGSDPDNLSVADIEISFEGRPVADNYYEEDPFNKLIKAKCLPDGSSAFLFPNLGLKCLEYFRDLSNDNLLLIVGDKGVVSQDPTKTLWDLGIEKHGSFSMLVDFEVFQNYFQLMGGTAVLSKQISRDLVVALFSSFPMDSMTQLQMERSLELGPNDFLILQELMARHKEKATLEEIIAIIKLSRNDPVVLLTYLKRLFEVVAGASLVSIRNLEFTIDETWQNYFDIGEKYDFSFKLGLLLTRMNLFEKALLYFIISSENKTRAITTYNIALCHAHLGQNAKSLRFLEEVLQLEPQLPEAIQLRDQLKKINHIT